MSAIKNITFGQANLDAGAAQLLGFNPVHNIADLMGSTGTSRGGGISEATVLRNFDQIIE